MQYKQNFVGQADYPWSKKFGNFVKKDQIFISLENVPDSFDASMEEKCFNMINGVLPNNYDLNTDWSVCASTQRDAGWWKKIIPSSFTTVSLMKISQKRFVFAFEK